ncbi:TetR/AcrR family transcriptional regulator [Agromyces archimandritae]|uniref:TetR family transcriptional regulator C-terminal domain-containing protein n=1 Tax=Agromyces archimandritae TaxID=2781962 RepID=A0A975IN25_9MICO|nr:TetR family transcriptional regulator C-terminal domain-containing protein [Agromyces archimandritae]QTX04162.1 TetR family transcriptional regulator C-terminal domain-containing protein [Agromyces archimandritae]
MARIPAAERRTALVQAALGVVAREGISHATTRAIVAEAGMSLASFHYAFASRDELIDELIAHVVQDEREALLLPEFAEGRSLPEVVEAGFRAYFAHLQADPGREQAMLELTWYALRSPERHPIAREQYARYAEMARDVLEAAARRTGARWLAPVDTVASVLIALTDGLTVTWLVNRDDAAAEAFVRAASDTLTRMAELP